MTVKNPRLPVHPIRFMTILVPILSTVAIVWQNGIDRR